MGAQYLPVGSRRRTSSSFLPKGHRPPLGKPGKDCSDRPGASRECTQPPQHGSKTSSRKSATTLIIPRESLKWLETIPIHLRNLKKHNPYTGSSGSSTTSEDSASTTTPTMVGSDAPERPSSRRKCAAVSCDSLTTGVAPTHASDSKWPARCKCRFPSTTWQQHWLTPVGCPRQSAQPNKTPSH